MTLSHSCPELSCSWLVASDLRLRGVKWAGFPTHAQYGLPLLEDQGDTRSLLPRWLTGKEPTCQGRRQRDMGSIPGSGRSPGGGHGNSLQYSCLENPHGQRSLVCYSPWVTESDTTKHTCHAKVPIQTLPRREVIFLPLAC